MPIANPVPVVETIFTSLPSEGVDGQIINYLADSTNGIVWRLRYRAGSSSAYKWERIGGNPLASENPTNFNTSTTLNQYTVDVNVTVPLAGEYRIEVGCDCWWSSSACFLDCAILVNAETAPATANDQSLANLLAVSTRAPAYCRRMTPRVLAAGDVVNAGFASGTAGVAATVDHRWIIVTPVRLGV